MVSTFNDAVTAVFDEQGVLANQLTGYRTRQQQIELAVAVANAVDEQHILLAEAGTGIGKTYAYLVPAILSGKKCIISTGTKNLQDQLFHRDIPQLKQYLGITFKSTLLKGRHNYLCHHRFYRAQQDPLLQSYHTEFEALQHWIMVSKTGDLGDTDILLQQPQLWPQVTSNTDNCLGNDCQYLAECFINEARKKAQEADIVVVNHHVLLADITLKIAEQGELLPAADSYIIDEAHQFPTIAIPFFSDSISSQQMHTLCQDVDREMQLEAPDMSQLAEQTERVRVQLTFWQQKLKSLPNKISWQQIYADKVQQDTFDTLLAHLEQLEIVLSEAEQRSKGLQQCYQRLLRQRALLSVFQHTETEDNEASILWLEQQSRDLTLHASPQTVGETFQHWCQQQYAAWIYTSATLTVAGRFQHFCRQLALDNDETQQLIIDSPFDYQKQSLLYLPTIPVAPQDETYIDYIIHHSRELIELSSGGTFLLFTSFKTLHQVAEALSDIDNPLFIQGSKPKNVLLDKFRTTSRAVLLGTNSFWEGVDVKGTALSAVLIDKIPFTPPDDPIIQAKIHQIKQQKGNPFTALQIPSAIIQLKQGVGRLIRDYEDYGVLVLCDPRLLNKPYGKLFLRSLPAMPITQDRQHVIDFFEKCQ